jgi:hypothetical protein
MRLFGQPNGRPVLSMKSMASIRRLALFFLALAGGAVALEINARRHPPIGKIVKSFSLDAAHSERMSLFFKNLPMHAIRRLAPYDILKTVGHVFALAANVSAFDQFWLIN